MKFPQIIPNLYMRPQFHSQKTKLESLQAEGIDVVVCLQQQPDPDLENLPWLHYVHVPLFDSRTRPVPAEVTRIAIKVMDYLGTGHKVLVHCTGGRNRSGVVVGEVLWLMHGWNSDKIIETIRAVRPKALTNETFVQYLRDITHIPSRRIGVSNVD